MLNSPFTIDLLIKPVFSLVIFGLIYGTNISQLIGSAVVNGIVITL